MTTKEKKQQDALEEIFRIASFAISNRKADEQNLRKSLRHIRALALGTVC